jgi:sigma-E factor negative regulatory protein RseA
MESVSALMDGELDHDEAARLIPSLKQRGELREAWAAYHLIGDALRGQRCTDCVVANAVSTQLAKEPTVLAPHAQRSVRRSEARRWALPSLAAAAAVATVTWMSLETQQAAVAPLAGSSNAMVLPVTSLGGSVHNTVLELVPTVPASPPQPAPQIQLSARELQPYLMAHQEFSPSTTIQGLAPYVRTVVSNVIER